MHRLATLTLLLVACGSKSDAPTAESSRKAVEAKPTEKPAAKPDLPEGRDAEAAKLVKAGAACKVKDDDIEYSCPERKAAGDYAFNKQQSKEIAATCAELVRDQNLAIKLVAAHCLDRLTSVATTPVLGHVLDSIEAEPNRKVQRQIAWGIKGAQAVTAKLEDRVITLVEKLAATPEGEDAAGSVLDTLFPEYMIGGAPKPPKKAQDIVLNAFARKKGGLMIRACDKVRLVEDKAAACKAVAGAITVDSPEWWRAIGALNDLQRLGAPCGEYAPAAIDVALAIYAKGDITAPQEMWHLAEAFELTPELRKKAAADFTKVKAKAPEWKKKDLERVIETFNKPYEAPKKK
jgi:hypothetical protein